MSAASQIRIEVSSDAATRLRLAAEWLTAFSTDTETLVLAHSHEAASDFLLRSFTSRAASFGIRKFTLNGLASRLARHDFALSQRAPASPLSFRAVVARAVHQLYSKDRLPYFAPVATKPGFAVAVAKTLEELRMNDVKLEALERLDRGGEDLAALANAVEKELKDSRLADRAEIFRTAIDSIASGKKGALVGQPFLLLDVQLRSRLDIELIRALGSRASAVLAIVPEGDRQTIAELERALDCESNHTFNAVASDSLSLAKRHLFESTSPVSRSGDESLTIHNWPGEPRECVEIVRSIQAEAARGTPFDAIAVLLNSPNEYRAHLGEAFSRAAIPAYFAYGSTAPDPSGRAMLALLSCAAERLSARAFAEYLSLAQVPDPEAEKDPETQWVAARDELVATTAEVEAIHSDEDDEQALAEDEDPAGRQVVSGSLRVPSRWERLLVESAVIHTKDRWARRLSGLEEELRVRIAEVAPEEEARVESIKRQLNDLRSLRDYALPLIEILAGLQTKSARWAQWLVALRELAVKSLRDPDGVLATLAELEPMGPVGPVDLREVQLVLAPKLRDLRVPPPSRRYGCVFVGPVDLARGFSFRVVFVPGLAERLFPRKVVQDPIVPDEQRRQTEIETLALRRDRVEHERLSLRLALGSAEERVYLSYPRIDVQQSRPRVPSVYALESLRAAAGPRPGFEEMAKRAEARPRARLGWPAPERPEQAIDEAEYDLATLGSLVETKGEDSKGRARYLLSANPHLARALRGRSRRWLRRWTQNDGLVDPDDLARSALQPHQFSERAFSATALQHFAGCPYRFFLSAILRLDLRQEPAALETLDPLPRGSLFHETQFQLLSRLREDRLLPLDARSIDQALEILNDCLDRVADDYRERLAPAINRVWEDAVSSIRADLREWLRRLAGSRDGWIPDKFELSFGLTSRGPRNSDPASVRDPVEIIGDLKLRGSIDLTERQGAGSVRVTDHKTGKARAERNTVVGGGKYLQPLLYALAFQKIVNQRVESGRLYYCTSDGNFEERIVPLDDENLQKLTTVLTTIRESLADAFLPAAPDKGECNWCDFLAVCGPFEETRTRAKPAHRLVQLQSLRKLI